MNLSPERPSSLPLDLPRMGKLSTVRDFDFEQNWGQFNHINQEVKP